jgi:hypothetical protein
LPGGKGVLEDVGFIDPVHRQLVVCVEETGAIRQPGQAEHGSADLCGIDVDELLLGGTVKIAQEYPGAAVGPICAVLPGFIKELVGAGGGGSPGEKIAADRQGEGKLAGDHSQLTVSGPNLVQLGLVEDRFDE